MFQEFEENHKNNLNVTHLRRHFKATILLAYYVQSLKAAIEKRKLDTF